MIRVACARNVLQAKTRHVHPRAEVAKPTPPPPPRQRRAATIRRTSTTAGGERWARRSNRCIRGGYAREHACRARGRRTDCANEGRGGGGRGERSCGRKVGGAGSYRTPPRFHGGRGAWRSSAGDILGGSSRPSPWSGFPNKGAISVVLGLLVADSRRAASGVLALAVAC
jgi:hypothetical protein